MKVNTETDVDEVKLQVVTLDYVHGLFPVSSCCVQRLFGHSARRAENNNYNKNYYIKAELQN